VKDGLNEAIRANATPRNRPDREREAKMGGKKPLVVVTRKLPDVVETRMRELFDARLNSTTGR
jgi:hypothetical protein